jgi:hypothetical protein
MKRSRLRRRIERLAFASLLGSACGHPTAHRDLGGLTDGGADLACPVFSNGCYWLQYVDFGVPSDNITYWAGDGGADPCGPCGFEKLGAWCGQCEIVANTCGKAYFCSILDCTTICSAAGRRPAGLALPSLEGDWLAQMAHLEAASVPAFTQLERELAAHGAPERLQAAARRARLDEVRHAAAIGALARAAGSRPLPLDVCATPIRPLAHLALENAVEGCVRETAGAVLAAAQAQRLVDRAQAELFAGIAVDERRHADLAWAVDAWALPRLDPADVKLIERARQVALQELFAA